MSCIHDYQTVNETVEGIVEVCKLCKNRLIIRKKNGKYDNAKYLEEHKRDFVQPKGRDLKLFTKLYGKPCKTK